MSQNRSTHARKNYAQPHVVLTNDDLLTEILIRLPILCISLFTTVSKQWLRILTSHDFTRNRRKILNLDPPAGLFVNHLRSLFECDFVSLDSRLDSRKSTMDNSFGSADEVDHVRILQSCNGLLLCTGSAWPIFYYVYHPSTNLFKRLPQPENSHDDSCFYRSVVLRMAFDSRKSFDYKVMQAGRTYCDIEIQIYSSETGNWSLCMDRFNYFSFDHFDSAIYWNDAFHYLEGLKKQLKHYKLNIEDHDHPIMTTLEIPHGSGVVIVL
ncbi:ribonuclease H-like domain-containing protein [Tanacetum coccineum]